MRRAVLAVATLVLVVFAMAVVRETRDVVTLAMAVDVRLGYGVLIALLALYAVCIGVPVVRLLRLPRALVPPGSESDPAFPEHLRRLGERLAGHPRLAGLALVPGDRPSIEAALAVLHQGAREEMTRAAGTVFLATAVSQSGRLDALVVLVAQVRMVWRIAHLYAQRPGPRELLALYANVAAAVLIVQGMEELDLEEIVEPVLAPVVAGSAVGAVPGFSGVATFVTHAVLEGAFNAFLTLRVGCIASRYCGAVVAPDRRQARRSAIAEASGMLPGIVLSGAERVSVAVWAAARRRAVGERATALRGALTRSVGAFRAATGFPRRRSAAEGPSTGQP